jgi:hypothetical protein
MRYAKNTIKIKNTIYDEIRSETINNTFAAQKHGASIRCNAHMPRRYKGQL